MTSSVGLQRGTSRRLSTNDWRAWSNSLVTRVAKRKDKKHPHPRMHQSQRTADTAQPQSKSQTDPDERRSHRREEGVLSRIEDITYKVLRQHQPKKS